MAYFMPSSIQKRLLRFALSRLELLDTDALELESLDIAWGKRSTIELRDVGLKLQKISSVLHLPPRLALTSAKILSLRVTVPADIYASGIVVDVDGVNVLATALSDDPSKLQRNDSKKRATARRAHRRAAAAATPSSSDDDAGNDAEDDHIPTSKDMALSFLQDEPPAERAELAEALHHTQQQQSQLLSESVLSSSTDDDAEADADALGTGTGLTLPGFVAAFLQGVADRLQVVIRNVNVQVSMDVPGGGAGVETPALPHKAPQQDQRATFDFHVASVEMDGVAAATSSSSSSSEEDGMARSGSDAIGEEEDLVQSRILAPSAAAASMTRSGGDEEGAEGNMAGSGGGSGRMPLEESVLTTDEDRFADVGDEDDDEVLEAEEGRGERRRVELGEEKAPFYHGLEESQLRESMFDDNAVLDEVAREDADLVDSRFEDSELAHSQLSQAPASHKASPSGHSDLPGPAYMHASSLSYPQQRRSGRPSPAGSRSRSPKPASPRPASPCSQDVADDDDDGDNSNTAPSLASTSQHMHPPLPPAAGAAKDAGSDTDSSASSSSAAEEDLARSRLFSHEEAESMYMSALSRAGTTASSAARRVPGGWDSASEGSSEGSEGRAGRKRDAEAEERGQMGPRRDGVAPREMERQQAPREEAECETPRPRSPVAAGSTAAASEIAMGRPTIEELGSCATASGLGKGALQTAKDVLLIDEVVVWLPGGDEGEEDEGGSSSAPTTDQAQSQVFPEASTTFEDVPGSFSQYAEAGTSWRRRASGAGEQRRRGASLRQSLYKGPAATQQQQQQSTSPKLRPAPASGGGAAPERKPTRKDEFEVEVGAVQLKVDVAAGKLFFQMAQVMQTIMTSEEEEEGERRPEKEKKKAAAASTAEMSGEEAPDVLTAVKIAVREINCSWLERLEGVSPTMRNFLRPPAAAYSGADPEAILSLNVRGVDVHSKYTATSSSTRVDVSKLTFGFPGGHDILCFSAESRLRTSVRDLREPLEKDVSLSLARSPTRFDLHVNTLPLMLRLDVQRLDDALGAFGGLSGVLELGNSIASNSTLLAPPAPPKQGPPPSGSKPRGVRFDNAPPPASPSSQAGPPAQPPALKANVRIAGVGIALQGRTCGVSVQTSAVKAVSREKGVGLSIDEIKFSGPQAEDVTAAAPVVVASVMNTRAEFLFSPEEKDLTRLLEIITPSRDKYENDDDILIDTLVRQRKKGSVLRANAENVSVEVASLQDLQLFNSLGEELAKLSTVTKYLPEDDRPGLLTLGSVANLDVRVAINSLVGTASVDARNFHVAHVTMPSLLAIEVGQVGLWRNEDEELVGEVLPQQQSADRLPMLMARMVGDEMEPTVKLKLFNVCLEYRVETVLALLGLNKDGSGATVEDVVVGMAGSVATITDRQLEPGRLSRQSSGSSSEDSGPWAKKPLHVDVLARDCVLGLNPRDVPAKGLFVLTNTRFAGNVPTGKEGMAGTLEVRKASMLIIDDVGNFVRGTVPPAARSRADVFGSPQVADLCLRGFVSVNSISAAKASVNVVETSEGTKSVDLDLKDDLFVLETCADSTQTLIGILNGLKPPMPPSKELKYRTEVMPVQNMMASFTGDAFEEPGDLPSPPSSSDEDLALSMDQADTIDDELPTNLEFVGSFYNPGSLPSSEDVGDSMLEDDLAHIASPRRTREIGQRGVLESFQEQYEVAPGAEGLEIDEDFFGARSEVQGRARKWDSSTGEYSTRNEFKAAGSPLKVRVRDVHIIWNLFDGYDWTRTRDTIARAVKDVEARAEERRAKRTAALEEELPNEEPVDAYLFGSIWINIPDNQDPAELRRQINHDVDDLVSETESYATTAAMSRTPSGRTHTAGRGGGGSGGKQGRRLKLERSKRHKITFELKGVSADMVVFPPGDETQSSLDVRVFNFEIFDHVPSSTWKKFATYMHDAGEREMGRPMIHLEMLNVRPVPDLAATEMVVKATVLPLRLHVDQDALDFITRFFEFKDDSLMPEDAAAEKPYIQRIEVNTVRMRLDYKPKKVDYAGLRSGHTTEFMNFFILDGADIILRHVIIYGVNGFDSLHRTLNDVWLPDVKRNQLPQVLAGLAPVRSLVNVSSGVRDLVVVPLREYRRDGRVLRAVQKGATAFARTTTSELARLGAKLAIGTQNVLQGAEDMLSPTQRGSLLLNDPLLPAGQRLDEWEDATGAGGAGGIIGGPSSPAAAEGSAADEQQVRAVSHYADQPFGVMAGLRGAARSLERDLLTARDAVVAIPGEVLESGSAGGATRAVARRAPTVILRPAIGVSKAISKTLLGAGNALDRDSRRRIEDVSCFLPGFPFPRFFGALFACLCYFAWQSPL
ncbi:hypothetical protein BDY21DRAFT_284675 [Lineolata rhizophorae]|uniref:Autophagy-related protein 2 n=1 Tax=Lineolata rhizophorae TaxID=578093 RepID=A0A6A6P377_9PEZI|nr:hypothetical protein BDY21DRAFT_284675 [Lineolata rhizophorae]